MAARECARCGISRSEKTAFKELCRDCTYLRIAPAPDDEIASGEWQQQHGIRVYVFHACEDCGEHLTPGERCDTCLTWAVKNARDFEWARMSWANRGRIWDVLELRHEQELMSA